MADKISPAEIWKEYQAGVNFNQNLNLYDTVAKNERFYMGRQWEGLKAPDLEQPVLNFLKRVIAYFMAMIVSDDVGISIRSFNGTAGSDEIDSLLEKQAEQVIERAKLKAVSRSVIRDAAVDGTGYVYLNFNADAPTGQAVKGAIEAETVAATNIIFGNPYDADLQRQPHIIIVQRRQVKALQREAKDEGIENREEIIPDSIEQRVNQSDDYDTGDMATVLIKLWKDKKTETVHFAKCTQNVLLKDDTDTGCQLYPLASFRWEEQRNCYHGQAAITDGVIQNQIFVNTMWALFMIQAKKSTFPTVFYDSTKIAQWVNKPGGAVAVQGSPDANVVMNYKPADFSQQAVEIVQRTIDYTKEFMGASDAALGNVKPENTSAIIAVQKASSAPLELQRLAFYQFTEDYVRIIIDIICHKYGNRFVAVDDDAGRSVYEINFGNLAPDTLELNVDVGSSAYWSELMQMQTADNLFVNGIITDAAEYLESIPDAYIKNKAKLIDSIRQQQQMQQAMMPMQGGQAMMPQGMQGADLAAIAAQAAI